ARDVGEGTVRRSSATCPVCGYTTPAENVRKQFLQRKGGANDARLIAVVIQKPTDSGPKFRLPCERDKTAFVAAGNALKRRANSDVARPAVPDEPLPYLRSIFNIHLLG